MKQITLIPGFNPCNGTIFNQYDENGKKYKVVKNNFNGSNRSQRSSAKKTTHFINKDTGQVITRTIPNSSKVGAGSTAFRTR